MFTILDNSSDLAADAKKRSTHYIGKVCTEKRDVLRHCPLNCWRQDRDVVLAAVQQRGMALRYAAEAMLLGCSWDALGMLLGCSWDALGASVKLQSVWILKLPKLLVLLPCCRFVQELKGDRDVVKTAARQSKRALMLEAQQLSCFMSVVYFLRSRTDFGILAFRYAADFLRKDPAFVQEASTQAMLHFSLQ